MSASRTAGLLLRMYPPAWRARYGEELEALIVESSGGEWVPWRVRADVARAGARERLRAAGLAGDSAPGDRVRGGVLLTLCAWALFVIGGVGVQKFSEHWQDVTPAASRGLPSAAFAGLVIVAGVGSAFVLAAIGLALPSLATFLRGGGWPQVRRPVLAAAALTGVAGAATVALLLWARGLTARQRDGLDAAYGTAFVAWAGLMAVCLFAWTGAAVAAARRLELPAATLRAHAWIACAVTVAMGVMTAGTAIWWAALADAAPWFLAGRPVGSSASGLAPQLLCATGLMLVACLLGATGAQRALRALPSLSERTSG